MVCTKCGNELKNGVSICSKCGTVVPKTDQKIEIGYHDEVLYVNPPVITESHTFVSEEDFLRRVRGKEKIIDSKREDEMWDDVRPKKSLAIWTFVVFLLVVIGFVTYYVIIPNVLVIDQSLQEGVAEKNRRAFSSNDWKNDEFMIDGRLYQLNDSYSLLLEAGWFFVNDTYHVNLNSGEKFSTTIDLKSNRYRKGNFQIGIVNSSNKVRDIYDCEIWSIAIDNRGTDNPISFMLPGGIQTGSSGEEILLVYGELDEKQIYRVEEFGYTIYHYSYDYSQYLDLTVYDDGGLLQFSFSQY